MIKYCVICNKPFPAHGMAMTCSKECSKERKKIMLKEWEAANVEHRQQYRAERKDHFNELSRKYNRENPERRKEIRRKNYLAHREERIAKSRIQRQTPEYKERKNAARRQKTKEKNWAIAQEYQKQLAPYAINEPLGGKHWSEEFAAKERDKYKPIGVTRLTPNVCRCDRCGRTFIVASDKSNASHILNSRLRAGKSPCPDCGELPVGATRNATKSSNEFELAKLYPNFTKHCVRPEWLNGMELDLYDPVNKVAIEYHGMRYHSDCLQNNESCKHRVKADICETNGVQLIQIFEPEWILRRECVLDKLDAIFHKSMSPISARKLKVRIMETHQEREMVSKFMETNHIQGATTYMWAVALMDNEDIIACCTFKFGTGYASGGQVIGTSKYWELNRYATKLHTIVRGGLSRCIKAFERTHPDVKNIVSFADRRWTCQCRSAYSSAGFIETDRVPQNYQYTDLKYNHPLKNKQYMRKSAIAKRAELNPEGSEAKVFSWDKTERQMAEELGYYRIYDAGKIRYEMKINQ